MSGEGNGLATRDELLSAPAGKRRFAKVALPVSGLRVRIRSLTELELSRYQSAMLAPGGGIKRSKLDDASRRLIVLCVVDGEGNPLFQDSDLQALADWDSADSGHLYDECAKHCGINRQDIEDLVKASESMAAGSLVSD
jgi:hypothetical protein